MNHHRCCNRRRRRRGRRRSRQRRQHEGRLDCDSTISSNSEAALVIEQKSNKMD